MPAHSPTRHTLPAVAESDPESDKRLSRERTRAAPNLYNGRQRLESSPHAPSRPSAIRPARRRALARSVAVACAQLRASGTAHRCRLPDLRTRPGSRRQRVGAERSEEHTSELQFLMRISYAVFCLKKKNTKN